MDQQGLLAMDGFLLFIVIAEWAIDLFGAVLMFRIVHYLVVDPDFPRLREEKHDAEFHDGPEGVHGQGRR